MEPAHFQQNTSECFWKYPLPHFLTS
ncbi:MAG: hypothetical protein EBV19_04440 [Flavobacteriia bacterium]|nr:hypothetical protein [Flavobacteriia bacterium]